MVSRSFLSESWSVPKLWSRLCSYIVALPSYRVWFIISGFWACGCDGDTTVGVFLFTFWSLTRFRPRISSCVLCHLIFASEWRWKWLCRRYYRSSRCFCRSQPSINQVSYTKMIIFQPTRHFIGFRLSWNWILTLSNVSQNIWLFRKKPPRLFKTVGHRHIGHRVLVEYRLTALRWNIVLTFLLFWMDLRLRWGREKKLE